MAQEEITKNSKQQKEKEKKQEQKINKLANSKINMKIVNLQSQTLGEAAREGSSC